MTARVLGGRYEVTAVLKRGLGIETLRGVDLQTGAPVVIKQAALQERGHLIAPAEYPRRHR